MRVSNRKRGENHLEYAAIATVIMTCSVVTLLVAGAGGLRRVATQNNLCAIQDGECAKIEDDVITPEELELRRRAAEARANGGYAQPRGDVPPSQHSTGSREDAAGFERVIRNPNRTKTRTKATTKANNGGSSSGSGSSDGSMAQLPEPATAQPDTVSVMTEAPALGDPPLLGSETALNETPGAEQPIVFQERHPPMLLPPPPPPLDPFGLTSSLGSLAASFADSSAGKALLDGLKGIIGFFV